MNLASCPLCEGPGGRIVFEAPQFRVIQAEEAGFPAFYRLVWHAHVAEFSELPRQERLQCIEAVTMIEQCLRDHLHPAKINLATLGNVVPHLHWHVIARFDWDSHFPAPVWATPQREAPAERLAAVATCLPAFEKELAERLAALG